LRDEDIVIRFLGLGLGLFFSLPLLFLLLKIFLALGPFIADLQLSLCFCVTNFVGRGRVFEPLIPFLSGFPSRKCK
jgi:hypothetical protein